MLRKLTIATGLSMAISGLSFSVAPAATLSSQATALQQSANQTSIVQQVQWRGCRGWRVECAERWGWRTRGYFRCLARHGCW